MTKLSEVLLSTSGLALAAFMLSVTPGLAQPETETPLPFAQPSQDANSNRIPDAQADVGAQPDCRADIGSGAQALDESAQQGCQSDEGRQALNQGDYSRQQSLPANRETDEHRQAQLGGESDNGQSLNGESGDAQQQTANENYGSRFEENREADVQGSARGYDSDRDRHDAVDESEIHGQAGASEERYAGNPNAAEADRDSGADNSGETLENHDSYEAQEGAAASSGESLENHDSYEAQEGAAGGGNLLALGQISDPDRVLVNAEVEDNMGAIIGHVSRIEHEGGQDRAMIMLHDRKLVALRAEHFRFDPSRNLVIADLSEDQIEQSAG